MLLPTSVEDLVGLVLGLQRHSHAQVHVADVLVHEALAVHVHVQPGHSGVARRLGVAVGDAVGDALRRRSSNLKIKIVKHRLCRAGPSSARRRPARL